MKALTNAMKPREEGLVSSYIKPNKTRNPLYKLPSLDIMVGI